MNGWVQITKSMWADLGLKIRDQSWMWEIRTYHGDNGYNLACRRKYVDPDAAIQAASRMAAKLGWTLDHATVNYPDRPLPTRINLTAE